MLGCDVCIIVHAFLCFLTTCVVGLSSIMIAYLYNVSVSWYILVTVGKYQYCTMIILNQVSVSVSSWYNLKVSYPTLVRRHMCGRSTKSLCRAKQLIHSKLSIEQTHRYITAVLHSVQRVQQKESTSKVGHSGFTGSTRHPQLYKIRSAQFTL